MILAIKGQLEQPLCYYKDKVTYIHPSNLLETKASCSPSAIIPLVQFNLRCNFNLLELVMMFLFINSFTDFKVTCL